MTEYLSICKVYIPSYGMNMHYTETPFYYKLASWDFLPLAIIVSIIKKYFRPPLSNLWY